MIDDLVTRELTEPYRLLTSRAEYRLLLRQDNADLRLAPIGYQLGLIDRARFDSVEAKRQATARETERLERTFFTPANESSSLGAIEFLRRPEVNYRTLCSFGVGSASLAADIAEQVEIEVKYWGYIEKQRRQVERMHRLEEWHIPPDMEYDTLVGLRFEARQKLQRLRPATLGQASRIDGVTPADIAILMVHLGRRRRRH
jgi:tRNA uridine 5-carboxymethylaminomethyl modification enzyme